MKGSLSLQHSSVLPTKAFSESSAKWGVHIYDKYAEYEPVTSVKLHILHFFSYFIFFLHIKTGGGSYSAHILHICCILVILKQGGGLYAKRGLYMPMGVSYSAYLTYATYLTYTAYVAYYAYSSYSTYYAYSTYA